MRKNGLFLGVVLLGFVSLLSYAQAAVPFISLPLIPDATAPGGQQFTLTVNGTGFVSNSVVNWNGSALATQFVNGSQLTAIVPAADITTAGTASVTVVNPAPGGGTSNVVFFTVTANVGNSVGLGMASSPRTGRQPNSVAVGDFNGDGKLDLAVANGDSNTVSILLGDGTGHFTLASSPATGTGPGSVAVGDFNGDGKLDLAVLNGGSDTVSILLGDGTGHFTLASSPGAGNDVAYMAVGDFNGDGNLDLAVTNYYPSDTVSILLGDGTGHFTLAYSPAAGLEAAAVAVGDFNGDGNLDLAVTNLWEGTVSILLGDGTGNFTLAYSLSACDGCSSVAVGDFNGDGNLDLAITNVYLARLSILLGDGTGNFTLTSTPFTGEYPYSVAVGDFNGDGNLDLAVADYYGNTVSMLLGDGKGNFGGVSSPATGPNPVSVAVGDFNGDGKLDVAVANQKGNTVSILLQGMPELSPAFLYFATQLIGTSSNPQPVTLTNTGSATLDITSIATNNVNYSQTNSCGSSVPPNGYCTINVTFNPHEIGTLQGAVIVKDNAPTSPQKVPLTGVGTEVTLLPSSLDFGNQEVGITSQQTATLTNYGKRAVHIFGIHITGKDSPDFAQTNNCGKSVPAGGYCTIRVSFSPESTGEKRSRLEVKDDGGASPQRVALSGTGT